MIDRDSINASMLTSAAAIAVAVIVLLASAWSVVGAIFIGGDNANDPSELIARFVEQHEADTKLYQARVNGRSAFFRPPSRPRHDPEPEPEPEPDPELEPEPEPDPEPEPEPEPPPPPVPDEYGGPAVMYVLGDMVVFRNGTPGEAGTRVRVGQKRGEVDVVSVDPPRSVRLGYQPNCTNGWPAAWIYRRRSSRPATVPREGVRHDAIPRPDDQERRRPAAGAFRQVAEAAEVATDEFRDCPALSGRVNHHIGRAHVLRKNESMPVAVRSESSSGF